ncbi:hypothetical protein E2I00_005469 [Balaenoptera physalus]|uniref:Protein ripply3 n=1 Tax=Balaenoptera physalus TaxID=9770 RepID=A0A643BV76_BALPH|nr:hypothetical protein E2I00_005469 [Balaenoptera physalus]
MHELGDCVRLVFPPWDPSQCLGYRDNSKRKRSLSNTVKVFKLSLKLELMQDAAFRGFLTVSVFVCVCFYSLSLGVTNRPLDRREPLGFSILLYLPISKRQEYLQSSGEKVLASFPVQATIHFYNDESNSDEEQDQEVQPSDLQCQEAQDGPGGKGRDQLTSPGWQPGGCGGLGGKGPLPYPDSPEDAGWSASK